MMTTADAATQPRIVALTAAGSPVPLAFARLVEALRAGGADVTPLEVPQGPQAPTESLPKLSELKAGLQALAEQVVSTLKGEERASDRAWLASHLGAVQGRVDGVVALDPLVARQVFPLVEQVWPDAVRVAVDGDYHMDPAWERALYDDIVVPHASLASELSRVREGRARTREGGPIVAGAEATSRTLDDTKPQVVVSFARLEPGDLDPLLFQLSLARPDGFSLLLLGSGRPGVDELVRSRAGGYGLRGKRPRAGSSPEPWIRGAAVLVGRPSPLEAAAAVAGGVPQLLFDTSRALHGGDHFLVARGLAIHAQQPVTLAVQLESLLPGGQDRDKVSDALAELPASGSAGAAAAVVEAVRAGKPEPAEATSASAAAPGDGELEDIGVGAAQPSAAVPAFMNDQLRRAYLSEIILQQRDLDKQLARARGGREMWGNRLRLARTHGDPTLSRAAELRVAGLDRVITKLTGQDRELAQLRDRFAGRGPLSAADREAASRFMTTEVAATLDTLGARDSSAFDRLELNDALDRLKRRMRDD